jgi:hypothetical protein
MLVTNAETSVRHSSGVNLKLRRAAAVARSFAARSKFDPAIDDPEIESMDEAAIATLLTKVAHARPRPLAI